MLRLHKYGFLILAGLLIQVGLAGFTFGAQEQKDHSGKAVTILDGVFSADQAAKGQAEYTAKCVRCHEGSEADGPILMGRSFIERWREDSLYVLYNFVKTRMPPDGTIMLTDAEYLQIVSYLLNANGYDPGPKELTAEAAAAIRIVGKNGPQPLPNNTLVQVIGCMDRNSTGTWMLEKATDPARIRKGDEPTPAALGRSAARPLGTRSFQLHNFTNINLDFDPQPFRGHRVHVQGVLIRQSMGADRLSLVSLDSVASSCEF